MSTRPSIRKGPMVRRKTNGKKNINHRNSGLQGDSTSYTGPVMLPLSNEEAQIINVNFGYSSQITASGGVLNTVFPTSLVTSASGWSSMAAEWHEYRVVAMEVHLIPEIIYTGTQLFSPVYSVCDRATGAALTSYPGAADHESVEAHSSRYDLKRVIKMNGPEESVWTPTTTTFAWGWIKIYGNGFSSSQDVYQGLYKFLVQFRGHQ